MVLDAAPPLLSFEGPAAALATGAGAVAGPGAAGGGAAAAATTFCVKASVSKCEHDWSVGVVLRGGSKGGEGRLPLSHTGGQKGEISS